MFERKCVHISYENKGVLVNSDRDMLYFVNEKPQSLVSVGWL